MASFISVKRLRNLISDRSLDNYLVYLGPGEKIMLGPNHTMMSFEVDFRNEELIANESAWAPNAQGELMQIDAEVKSD